MGQEGAGQRAWGQMFADYCITSESGVGGDPWGRVGQLVGLCHARLLSSGAQCRKQPGAGMGEVLILLSEKSLQQIRMGGGGWGRARACAITTSD